MDNLSIRKGERIRRMIESRGVEPVFRPPRSPYLNRIEMIFSQIRQPPRSLACRTRDAMCDQFKPALMAITPEDARNRFRHCGYTLQMG